MVDFSSREIRHGVDRRRLTRTEVRLLQALLAKRGAPVAREDLLSNLWGVPAEGFQSRAVDVNIGRLRRKLEADPTHPQHILTVTGYGYLLQSDH